jgi:2-phosphoglycerate kinase
MENNSEEWLLDLGNLERTKKYDDIFEMKYKSGLVKNMESIITEFMKYRGLVVNKIIIGGLPSIGKSEISYKLANKCGVIHI